MWHAYKGGSYEEVAGWLLKFVNSHAKRESPKVEGLVETSEGRKGESYGLRLRLGDRLLPPADQPPKELAYRGVSEGRTRFAWCDDLARRVRGWARQLLEAESDQPSKSA
ncbi:MAG: hypothetical protein ACE5JN_16930 [Candidatus Methylomirabilia bacterium]